MPDSYTLLDKWLDNDASNVKNISAKAREQDLKLVQTVFPESGVTSYLTAMLYKKLADQLRAQGITHVGERHQCESFKDLQALKNAVRVTTPNIPEEYERPDRA